MCDFFRLALKPSNEGTLLQASDAEPEPNLTKAASQYLSLLDADEQELLHHCLSILHSPAYREENVGAIRHDWPRVPLPASHDRLRTSARLGQKLGTLLDPERDASRYLSGTFYAAIGPVTRVGGGSLDPNADDLAVTAGWGYTIRDGTVTMPGQGHIVERDYAPEELEELEAGAASLNLDPEQLLEILGRRTCDVYLNDVAYWRNVPAGVWDYTLGGYPVIKKWLSYREERVLGRHLRPEEARAVTDIARRITEILMMGPALDENYAAVKRAGFDWPPRLG